MQTSLPKLNHAERRQRRERMANEIRHNGKDVSQVAIEFGVTPPTVFKACRDAGFRPNRRSGSGGPPIVTKEQWEQVDWEQRDVDIARNFAVSRERVRQVRRKLGKPDSPAMKAAADFIRVRDWIKENRELVENTPRHEIAAMIPFAISRTTVRTCLKRLGITCPLGRGRAIDRITKDNFREFTRGAKNGCWEWTGTKNLKTGYGMIAHNFAHHASFRLFKGPIEADKWVLHTCDNPTCVNPDHLYLGTARDNAQDRVRRGRDGNAFFLPDQVREIRALSVLHGWSYSKIAAKFSKSYAVIYNLVNGRTYSFIPNESEAVSVGVA